MTRIDLPSESKRRTTTPNRLRRIMQERRRSIVPAVLLCTFACAENEEPRPKPFGKIALSMEQGSAGDYSNLRVALAWTNQEASRQLQITDDHAWPSDLGILDFGLTTLPTEETLYDWGSRQGLLSVGGLFAYEDVDDDGKFTFTNIGEQSFRDRVVGWSPGLRVVSAPADIAETSQFAPGYSLHTTTYEDGKQWQAIEELNGNSIAITIQAFDAPEAQCFGLSPGLSFVPAAVDTRPSEHRAEFGAFFENYDGQPYITGIPDCPFEYEDRPSGWNEVSATCIEGEESLVLLLSTLPSAPAIATMCGRQTFKCRMPLDTNTYPPRGFPPGICES